MIDALLEKFNLKYEDLSAEERDTFNGMLSALDEKNLTIEKIKDYIASMKFSVEQELTKIGYNSKQDLFLKARLKNYMLLSAFLESPAKARAALEQALSNIKK